MILSRSVFAFIAGFIAVLVFHQAAFTVLHALGVTPGAPFPLHATKPFGVPQIWSLAFWGGVWGILLIAVIHSLRSIGYWLTALLFGAILPTLVVWFVVLPLKGFPVGGGWHPAGIATGLIVNGAWGVGTALLWYWFGGVAAAQRVSGTAQP